MPPPNRSVSSGQAKMPSIVEGTILSVNPDNHTCNVARNNASGGPLNDVLLASLYCHPFSGEGIYFLPEPGATCYVYETSDPTNSFVFGYVMPMTEKDGLRGNRMLLNPGDYVLSTRDDNKIVLRRGGLIQIASTGLAQRLYIPLGNYIKDFFENYGGFSPNGTLEWTRDSATSEVMYTYTCKRNALDIGTKVDFSLKRGLLGSVDPERAGKDQGWFGKGMEHLSLTIHSDAGAIAGQSLPPELTFQVSEDGKLALHAADYIHMSTDEGLKIDYSNVQVTAPYVLQGPNYRMEIIAGRLKEQAVSVDRTSDTDYDIHAKKIVLDSWPTLGGGGVKLGGPGAISPVLKGTETVNWISELFLKYVVPLNLPPEPTAAATKLAEMLAFLAQLQSVKSLKVDTE